jgi:hypothetical protein
MNYAIYACKIGRDLLIWAKYTAIIVGIMASISFIRINYFGSTMELNMATTPIMMVPNAVIQEAQPMPRIVKK